MTVTSAKLHGEKPTSSVTGTLREYTVKWCVEFDDDNDGPLTILSGAIGLGMPTIGTAYAFGSEVDLEALAKGYGEHQAVPGNRRKVIVPVNYATSTPEDSDEDDELPPGGSAEDLYHKIEIDFQQYERPGTRFQFTGFETGDGTPIVAGDPPPPLPMDGPILTPGYVGPMRNSAGCPLKRNILKFKHIVRVTTFVSSWDCNWQNFMGKWNNANVRFVERDKFGIRFDCTYPTKTLQLLDANKQNRKNGAGLLYYAVTWVLQYDPDGYVIRELDRGDQAAFVPGAWDPTYVFVSAGGAKSYGQVIAIDDERLETCKTGKRGLVDAQGNPLAGMALLNGEGVEEYIPNAPEVAPPIILVYQPVDAEALADFSTLPFHNP